LISRCPTPSNAFRRWWRLDCKVGRYLRGNAPSGNGRMLPFSSIQVYSQGPSRADLENCSNERRGRGPQRSASATEQAGRERRRVSEQAAVACGPRWREPRRRRATPVSVRLRPIKRIKCVSCRRGRASVNRFLTVGVRPRAMPQRLPQPILFFDDVASQAPAVDLLCRSLDIEIFRSARPDQDDIVLNRICPAAATTSIGMPSADCLDLFAEHASVVLVF